MRAEPRKGHSAFKLDFWKASHSVMDFRLTLEKVKRDEKVTSYLRQSQCRSGHQRRSKHLEKVTSVLSCLTSAESFITPDFVGTIPLDSVRFRRLHPTDSTTIFDQADDYQENASLSVSEQVPHVRIQKQQPQVSSWHGTDGVWFLCRPQLWGTTARLCF